MQTKEKNANLTILLKPVMCLALAISWGCMLYLRGLSFEDAMLMRQVEWLMNPFPLMVTSVVFAVFAIATPWPQARRTVAGSAAFALAVLGAILVYSVAPNGLILSGCLVLVVGQAWAGYALTLALWPSRADV